MIAAAFTGGDEDRIDDAEDKDIGELKFYLKSWNDTDTTPYFKLLKSRPCSTGDLLSKDSGQD